MDFVNDTERAMAPFGSLAMAKPFASKLAEQAVRMAGVLALVENPAATEVDVSDLGKAIELAKYFRSEFIRLVAAGHVSQELRQAEALRVWLLDRPEDVIPTRTVYQLGPTSIRDAASARAALSILQGHNWVEKVGPVMIDGSSCKEAWRIVRP